MEFPELLTMVPLDQVRFISCTLNIQPFLTRRFLLLVGTTIDGA
jgi:hypothetical protein